MGTRIMKNHTRSVKMDTQNTSTLEQSVKNIPANHKQRQLAWNLTCPALDAEAAVVAEGLPAGEIDPAADVERGNIGGGSQRDRG